MMNRNVLWALTLLTSFLFVFGCGGPPNPIPKDAPCPDWFYETPDDPEYWITTRTATSRDLQTAIDNATAAGRHELSNQIEVYVQGLTKRFNEEIRLEDDHNLHGLFAQATRQVTEQSLRGSRVAKQHSGKEENIWRACLMMEVPKHQFNEELVGQISKDEEMYVGFRESETFKELEHALQEKRAYEDRDN